MMCGEGLHPTRGNPVYAEYYGSSPKGRQIFLEMISSGLQYLDTANVDDGQEHYRIIGSKAEVVY